MASTATTTQINVRIDRELKAQGDAALLAAGLSPSEAIRALWELAVRLQETPGALRAALFPATAEEDVGATRRRLEAVAHAQDGQSIIANARFAARISAEAVAAVGAMADDNLYTEALYGQYGEGWSQ